VSEAGTDRAILYIITAASPARWLGPGARHRTGRCYSSRDSPGAPATCQMGPPVSMTQASSRGQYLPHLEAFVADNGCYVMCMKCASMQRVRARPGHNGP
jgi:hypothetical protein